MGVLCTRTDPPSRDQPRLNAVLPEAVGDLVLDFAQVPSGHDAMVPLPSGTQSQAASAEAQSSLWGGSTSSATGLGFAEIAAATDLPVLHPGATPSVDVET